MCRAAVRDSASRAIPLNLLWTLLIICVGVGNVRAAMAQDLTPRAYLITPVGSNAVILDYSHLDGGLQLNGAAPVTGAHGKVNLATASYYHSFDLFGRAANFAITVPYGFGAFYGDIDQIPKSEERSGLLDTYARLSVNLVGGQAMRPAEFAHWRQAVLIGLSIEIQAPNGQYDPTRLINWGNNRWAFKTELGYSQRWGHWVLDVYGAVWLFTENPAFFPGMQSQSEAPVGAVEAHLSYTVAPRLWVSLDANYWWGGQTSINGVATPGTNEKNSRVGVTAAIPITQHQSIKLSFSNGAYITYGGNYRNITIAWQYGWLTRS